MSFCRRVPFLAGSCFCILIISFWSYNKWSTVKITDNVNVIKQCISLTKNENSTINSLLFTSKTIVSEEERTNLSLKNLVIASTTSIDHIGEAIRSCDTFQQHPQLKNVPFFMYFIGKIPNDLHKLYVQLCPIAKIIELDRKKYSYFLEDLSQFKFKALYQALTLQKYKLVLAVDSSVRFSKSLDFNKLISGVIERNPLDATLLSSAKHAAYPVIHPDMFQCFPTINPKDMQKFEQFQGGLILWVRSKNGRKILKRLIECTLQESCIAPPGAKLHCDYAKIYSDNTTFSGCHRFDQSAINLILYSESHFQPKLFQWNYPDFIIEKSAKLIF